jgi:hypothetical protein
MKQEQQAKQAEIFAMEEKKRKDARDAKRASEAPERLKLSQEIWKWMTTFIESDEYKNNLKNSSLVILRTGWGYVGKTYHDKTEYCCYSRLTLCNSKLEYCYGYKMSGFGAPMLVISAEDMSDKFYMEYIKELHDHITSEAIYTSLALQIQ